MSCNFHQFEYCHHKGAMTQQGMGTEGKPQNAAAMIPMKLRAEDVCSSGVSALLSSRCAHVNSSRSRAGGTGKHLWAAGRHGIGQCGQVKVVGSVCQRH